MTENGAMKISCDAIINGFCSAAPPVRIPADEAPRSLVHSEAPPSLIHSDAPPPSLVHSEAPPPSLDGMNDRINHCLSHVAGGAGECAVCAETCKCQFH